MYMVSVPVKCRCATCAATLEHFKVLLDTDGGVAYKFYKKKTPNAALESAYDEWLAPLYQLKPEFPTMLAGLIVKPAEVN
jgi:hypothetical protein